MSIAPTLQRYLDQTVTYEMIPHDHTKSSLRTAEACHISSDQLAKGVVLRCRDRYVLAVLPASRSVRLADLTMRFGDDVDLAEEFEIVRLFPDCERGAVPAVGECYSLETIVDNGMDDLPDIYMEGGDHATLVHLDRSQFANLVRYAWRGKFSMAAR